MAPIPGMSGGTPKAPTEYRDHPGDAVRAGCPTCGDPDHIVIDVPLVMHHRVEVWAIPGITEAEFDVVDSDDIDPNAPVEQPTKVRCLTCKWSFTGSLPLSKLTPVQP